MKIISFKGSLSRALVPQQFQNQHAGRRNFETKPRGVPSVRFDKVAPPLESLGSDNDMVSVK